MAARDGIAPKVFGEPATRRKLDRHVDAAAAVTLVDASIHAVADPNDQRTVGRLALR